jgi:hypothetical protein
MARAGRTTKRGTRSVIAPKGGPPGSQHAPSGGAMLFESDVKEELSLAYVRAVAARAGFSVEETRKDRDSVDLTICARGALFADAPITSPDLKVQVKAATLGPLPEREFDFDVLSHNYNALVDTKRSAPLILVVFVMPKDKARWLSCTESRLALRQCAYWVSLAGQPPTSNKTKQRIKVPRAQIFSPPSLRELLVRVAREESLT